VHLAKLAKIYLCNPVTFAPSERVWSRASNILTTRRARMSNTVAASINIIFTKENSRTPRNHYTVLTGPSYLRHLPFIYDDSIEDYIHEDIDKD